jgi:hypothetical protein
MQAANASVIKPPGLPSWIVIDTIKSASICKLGSTQWAPISSLARLTSHLSAGYGDRRRSRHPSSAALCWPATALILLPCGAA